MRRRACVLLVGLALAAGCSGDDDAPVVTTTTTTTAAALPNDAEIIAAVHAASEAGAGLLPDEDWADAVGAACGELPGLEDGEVTTLFDLLRIQVENGGATREQSREAVVAFVGGLSTACPDVGARAEALVPAS